jgi:hypothetical protein
MRTRIKVIEYADGHKTYTAQYYYTWLNMWKEISDFPVLAFLIVILVLIKLFMPWIDISDSEWDERYSAQKEIDLSLHFITKEKEEKLANKKLKTWYEKYP